MERATTLLRASTLLGASALQRTNALLRSGALQRALALLRSGILALLVLILAGRTLREGATAPRDCDGSYYTLRFKCNFMHMSHPVPPVDSRAQLDVKASRDR